MRLVSSIVVFAIAAALSLPALAADPLPAAFYGKFSGTGLSETKSDGKVSSVKPRDFDVVIKQAGIGFTVIWKTVEYTIRPAGSKLETDLASVTFVPAGRAGLFRTEKIADITSGEPVYWARADGNTLTVSRLAIDAQGRAEIAVWQRTVRGDTMQLLFNRYGTASAPRTVKGPLTRVKP